MAPNDFLDQLVPAARTCQRTTGIPASFTLAQAALESSWGKRAIGCNLFGIKADKSWKGAVTMVNTHEVIKGKSTPMVDRFRCYASWSDCLQDRVEFFLRNPRYAKCFAEKTGEGWCRAAAAAGYATDPDYADKLIAIIRGRNLTRFDQVEKAAA